MEFINNFVNYIISFIESFGYLGVFLAVFLEYACLPLPSEVILPFVGIIASRDTISLIGVLFVSIVAGMLGSILCYYIGYFGGAPILNFLQKKSPTTSKGINKINSILNKYNKYAIFIARLIPLTRTYISLVVGSLKMEFIPFCLYSLGGITLWNTVLILLGYYLGENMDHISKIISDYSIIVLTLVLLSLTFYYFYKKRKSKSTS